MRTRLYTLLYCLLCCLFIQAQELCILHTSDTHSRIEPISAHAKDRNAGLGGVVRRATFVKEMREANPGLLLLECGDFSQGTPYYNFFKGELEIEMMNLMGYDAATIGNHEFDFGMENMARLYRLAKFPVVCANYDFTGTVLADVVYPYTVVERHGLRIGIFGLSPRLEGLVQADKCAGITYKDPVASAQRMADVLKTDEGCDVVICLSHLGYRLGNTEDIDDEELIARTRYIDLVLGGHTHSFMEKPMNYLNADGKEVPLLHSGSNGAHVGVVRMKLEDKEATAIKNKTF